MSVVSDDDLTTDAVPSPPRSDPENSTYINDVNIPKQKTSRKSKSSKENTKQIPNTGRYLT